MTSFSVRVPRGQVPRRNESLLGDNYAQVAENCKVKSGRCDPIKGLQLAHVSLAASIGSIHRYRKGELDNWLIFTRSGVDVARSPVDNDTLGRFFYSGDGEPRMSTYADAIVGDGPYPVGCYVLGVAIPVAAAAISVVGGTGVTEDRAYVYTFRTRYGEESGPSPATVVSGKVDGSWNMTGMNAKPPNSGTVSAAVKETPLPGQVQVTLDTVFGLAAGEEVTFAGVAGMTDLNGKFPLVSVDAATNKVVVALTTTQTYATAADTWTRVAPHNTTGMTKCIYRTIGTNSDFHLVAEIDGDTTTYNDTVPSTTVSLAAGLTTLDTLPPPKDLHGLILLANNSLAGISGNQVCLSEQGKPYSWPVANRYSFPGVGSRLVASDSGAIILTDNYPHLLTATVPDAGSVSKIPGEAAVRCVSALGVVDVGGAAMYPAHDGLYLASSSGVSKITAELFTMDEWSELMPETFRAAFYDGMYIATFQTSTSKRVFMLDTREPDSAMYLNDSFDAIYTNLWDSRMYVAKGSKVYKFDADDGNRYASSWRSKKFVLPKPVCMGVAQVRGRFDEVGTIDTTTRAANQVILASAINVLSDFAGAEILAYEIAGSNIKPVADNTEAYLQITLIQDGAPVRTKTVTSNEPFRLLAPKKSESYSVEVSGSIAWESIDVAENKQELAAIQ